MALTISVPDKIVHEIPVAEMDWFMNQEIHFDHQPTMETTVTYQNFTSREVWVAERTGAISSTHPRASQQSNCFCIKISRRRHASTHTEYDVMEMAEEGLGAVKLSTGISALDKSYTRENSRGMGMHKCFEVIFTIPLNKLQSHGGSIYHSETDTVIALTREHAVHPGSPQSRLRSLYVARQEDLKYLSDDPEEMSTIKADLAASHSSNMARVMVSIVDNEKRFGDKYVNLMGRAHLVRSKPSLNLADGVYIVRDERVNESGRTSKPTVTHYSFEDVAGSDIKLYDSSEAALKFGDPEKVAEMKSAELRAQNLLLKTELEKYQTENKLAITKESDQLEHKSMHRKDYYEDRSYSRKDNSEDLKYVFAAIAGLVGLLAVIIKK